MIYLTFTCRRDADLLPLWAAGIRRVDPSATLVAAVDEADRDMPLPSGVHRLATNFDRGGNLNGLACCTGIVATCLHLATLTGSPVCKIDSDTILLGDDWLSPMIAGNYDYIGYEGCIPLCASGLCYAITAPGARILLRELENWRWSRNNLPEDRTISRLAIMLLRDRALLVPWGRGEHIISFTAACYGTPTAITAADVAVHCAQDTLIAGYGSAPRTAITRRAMRHVLRCRAGRCSDVRAIPPIPTPPPTPPHTESTPHHAATTGNAAGG